MARSNVPKFGNWESEENIPYTSYFDKARKVRAPGGKIMNPNDPEENLDLQSQPPSQSRTKPEDSGGSSTEASNKRQGRTAATATATAAAAVSLNNSYEKSPLHSQAKDANKNSYDGSARSKPKPHLRADGSPGKVTVVPKFGDWDENNPASADGYTHIFNKVREERSFAANMTGSPKSLSRPNGHKPPSSKTCCCFGFGGN